VPETKRKGKYMLGVAVYLFPFLASLARSYLFISVLSCGMRSGISFSG